MTTTRQMKWHLFLIAAESRRNCHASSYFISAGLWQIDRFEHSPSTIPPSLPDSLPPSPSPSLPDFLPLHHHKRIPSPPSLHQSLSPSLPDSLPPSLSPSLPDSLTPSLPHPAFIKLKFSAAKEIISIGFVIGSAHQWCFLVVILNFEAHSKQWSPSVHGGSAPNKSTNKYKL